MKFRKGELLHGGTVAAILSQIAVSISTQQFALWGATAKAEWKYRPVGPDMATMLKTGYTLRLESDRQGKHFIVATVDITRIDEGAGTIEMKGNTSWTNETTD